MIDIEGCRARFETEFERAFPGELRFAKKTCGQFYVNRTTECIWRGWLAAKADTVVVTEEMVERATSEIESPTVPTVFSRCVDIDGVRAYIVGYADETGHEVIRYQGPSSRVCESIHSRLEAEVLARAVLTAALNGEGK